MAINIIISILTILVFLLLWKIQIVLENQAEINKSIRGLNDKRYQD